MRLATVTPNDPLYGQQWHLSQPVAGINAPAAWAITTGASTIRVADLDTGARFDHEDLRGRLLAGYDFLARNFSPADPGMPDSGHTIWHGTYTAGVIGAAGNNGAGIAGVNWVSPIQVVRVMGGGFGYASTTADAIRWAAGISVPNVPPNPAPSRVINLSLTAYTPCDQTLQSAVQAAIARGAVVISAAGNENHDTAGNEPSSCPGVITVAAVGPDGSRAPFSNFGTRVDIAAPGTAILTTGSLDVWKTSGNYIALDGTSMAAPIVSGVVALMLSVNPGLTADAVRTILKQTARRFPPWANCTGICHTGLLDAGLAVQAAAGKGSASVTPPGQAAKTAPLRAIAGPPQTVRPGARVVLAGGARLGAPLRVVAWQWQQLSGPPVVLSHPNVARPVFVAPRTNALLVFHLAVKDSAGRTAGAATRVAVSNTVRSAAARHPSAATR